MKYYSQGEKRCVHPNSGVCEFLGLTMKCELASCSNSTVALSVAAADAHTPIKLA